MFFKFFVLTCFPLFVSLIRCENRTSSSEVATLQTAANEPNKFDEFLEQGRTFVHGTVKRFMVLMPVIFFKLGIAFTLLLIVTLVAVNNGFIGFLILVVGLSSVLARLQGNSVPSQTPPIPISYAAPLYRHHAPYPSAALTHSPIWINRRSDIVTPNSGSLLHQNLVTPSNSNEDYRNTGAYFRDQQQYMTEQKV